MRTLRWVALLAIAGCGSSSGMASTSSVPPTTTPSTMTVMVGPTESFSFSPQTVNINAGDTVTWEWVSTSVPHTVTSGTPGAADGQFCSLPSGTAVNAANCNSASYARTAPNSFSQTFPTAGTFPYFCEVHGAMMTGTVVVGGASGGSGGGGGGGAGGMGGGGY